jgi:hypothetical protein
MGKNGKAQKHQKMMPMQGMPYAQGMQGMMMPMQGMMPQMMHPQMMHPQMASHQMQGHMANPHTMNPQMQMHSMVAAQPDLDEDPH